MIIDIDTDKIRTKLAEITNEIDYKKEELMVTCKDLKELQEELADTLDSLDRSIEDLELGIENMVVGISEINSGIDYLAQTS